MTPDELYEKLKGIAVDNPLCNYTFERCVGLTPIINEILQLKAEKNALILAHVYCHPDIVHGVADFVGDSYGLAKNARDTDVDTIVFPSVRFMAETAKILNPTKEVLDPNPNGGCSLASSITADEVYLLREKYPKHTFVCYVNTTAAVKAACDVCVTSSNALRVIQRLPTDLIYFLPDRLLAENVSRHVKNKEILAFPGTCYVHEEIDAHEIDLIRYQHPDVQVLAHPECKPEVVKKASFVGSTTEMHRYVMEAAHDRPFLLLSECGVATRLAVEAPKAKLVGGCRLCKYMRSNSLQAIASALKNPTEHERITIEPTVLQGARRCLERMFEYAE